MKVLNVAPRSSTRYNCLKNKNNAQSPAKNNNVNFQGKFEHTPTKYEYESQELLGNKETITYNKEDGSFTFKVSTRAGDLTTRHFNPSKGEETVIETTEKGVVEKRKSPVEESTKKYDAANDLIYSYQLNKETGDSVEFINDKRLKRQIAIKIVNGIKDVRVLDTEKNAYVTMGELAWVTELDKERNVKVTRNVITDIVVKEESLDPEHADFYIQEYDEMSGILTRKVFYDRENKLHVDNHYDFIGNITSQRTRSRNGKLEQYVEVDPTGAVVKDIRKKFNRNDRLIRKEIMFPGSNNIQKEIIYEDDYREEYTYMRSPNLRKNCSVYDFQNNLMEYIEYHRNGQVNAHRITYNSDGSRHEYSYDKKGFLTSDEEYSSSGFMLRQKTYHQGTNKKSSMISINPISGITVRFDFAPDGHTPTYYLMQDRHRNTIEGAVYHQNGTMSVKYEYKEGFCIETHFDEEGRVIDVKYNSYNTHTADKEEKFRTFNSEFDIPIDDFTEPKKEITEEERMAALEKVSNMAGLKTGDMKAISDKDWEIVLDTLELEDYSQLENMDKALYRKLAKKFHPDLNPSTPVKSSYIINIITYFYEINQNSVPVGNF